MLVQLSLALGWLAVSQVPESSPAAPARFEENFESTEPKKLPAGWIVPTKGYEALVTDQDPGEGRQSLLLRSVEEKGAPFGNCMRTFDARPYTGQRIVLTALVKVEAEGGGRAQMWLRVDRPGS